MIPRRDHELFRGLCEKAQTFVLTTHVQPDGDAIGSQYGLSRFLLSRGKQVRIGNRDPTSEQLRFVEEAAGPPVEIYDPGVHDPVIRDADLVILLDNSAPDRLGRMEPIMRSVAEKTLCIDHHPSRGTPWTHLILNEATCATAVMVYELISAWGWTPDAPAAEAIFVGLATDTGFFRFNSTNAEAYDVAAEMYRIGVDPARIYRAIYERNSLAYTRLLGHVLVNVTLEAGGAIALVKITRELIERLDADDVDTSEITTALLAMDGVTIALLFRELKGGKIKISLRSKGVLDVHLLATEFGGGGHRNASGIVLEGDLDEVVRKITGRTTELLHGGT